MSTLSLLSEHPGLAGPMCQLTTNAVYVNPFESDDEVPTAIAMLREACDSGDPVALDAALREVIRQAQAARKALKAPARPPSRERQRSLDLIRRPVHRDS